MMLASSSETETAVQAVENHPPMKPRDLYFNHAGTSWPKPDAVTKAVHLAMLGSPSDWSERFDQAHRALADYFCVQNPEQLLLTPGCTSALSIGISDALLTDGQVILTSRWEHHGLHRPLVKKASEGFPIQYIPAEPTTSETGSHIPIDLMWLEERLAKHDVGLVAITAACNVTGAILPYHEVIQLAHRYGSTVLIDAAQVVGWMRLDLNELGADMVAFGGHKGLQAPWGIGGLYLSDQFPMQCVGATCTLPKSDLPQGSALPRPGYCDVGSVDQFALAGLHAAVQVRQGNPEANTLDRARRQLRRICEPFERCDGIRLYSPQDPNQGLPTLAFKIIGFSSPDVAGTFLKHGIFVGSGLQCAPLAHETLGTEDSGLVRLSVGIGQADDDIDEVIERLEFILKDEFKI